jgi:hypothetical protein
MLLRENHHRVGVLVSAAALCPLLWFVLLVVPGRAGATPAGGTALVVHPNGGSLSSGGSSTPFGLKLPAHAACPGDTAHQGYSISSYVVPVSVAPGAVVYGGGGFAQQGSPMVDASLTPYLAVNTDIDTGEIPPPPIFSWTSYAQHGGFPMGTYNVGVACATRSGATARYWNTVFRFTADSADRGGFTWSIIGAPKQTSGGSTAGTVVGVVIAVIVIGGIATLLLVRRRPTLTRSRPGVR